MQWLAMSQPNIGIKHQEHERDRMNPQWVGKALLLITLGVTLGLVLRVVVARLPSETRKTLQLYLLIIAVIAAIGFGSTFPVFDYFTRYNSYGAEISGTVLVACFIVLCVVIAALFYEKRS
jgi:uncharacterized membrane protein